MKLSARRLRRLPAVVLPQVPQHAWLLDAVRRFDPDAVPVEDTSISFGAGIRLAGPQRITSETAAKIGLPPGHAWVASDSGPFQTWLVRGLAWRFGGHAHLPQPVVADDASEVVIVHTPRKISPDELAARFNQLVPGLRAGAPEQDGSFFLTSAISPVRIRCDSPDVPSLRWLLPLALGPMRQDPGLHGYRFGRVPNSAGDAVRLAATAALELAQGVGGVATDRDRFRVFDPDDPALYR
ncbi:hypothetical protein GCM10027176_18920 [Actinoallomurus bryophytorum]|uniref:Uncharacterized protein n=1 Tax=Actinoallomurus bryophytorum TaxID=1490222 RepID=A0A543CL52_9ACTN|nr:hypothetical protein [Actinoallomurus bryophytorum]TQL97831.1 hypothetical protein FB559_3437 [Actinoallomurus bryophytorum]